MSLEYAKYIVIGTLAITVIIKVMTSAKQMRQISDSNPESEELVNDFEGKALFGSSANISGSEFNGSLEFMVNENEFLVRSFIPPLFETRFQLSKLHGRRKRSLFFTYVYLTYDDDPTLEIRISEKLAKQIHDKSGANWSYENV